MATNATKIRGENLRIYIDDTGTDEPIAMAQECTVSMTTEMLEAAHKDSEAFVEREADTNDWSVSGTYLIAMDPDAAEQNWESLWDAWRNRQSITVKFSTKVSGDTELSGNAFISSLELSANKGEYATGTYEFMANGTLEKATVV